MQCHILAMVLAVTLDLSAVQEHCKLNNNYYYQCCIIKDTFKCYYVDLYQKKFCLLKWTYTGLPCVVT